MSVQFNQDHFECLAVKRIVRLSFHMCKDTEILFSVGQKSRE